jgi:ABC-type transporter Mla MlaB component
VERGDHVCWAYEDDASFEDAALRFLTEGLARGDRLLWVGDGGEDLLRRSGGPLAAVDDLLASGALRVLSTAEGYGRSLTFSPEQQLAQYDTATRAAIDAGYRGLRVVADVTPLAADTERRADLLRWEHLADDYVAHGPGFSALCAYRLAEVTPETVADAAAVHPLSHSDGRPTAFRVWFDDGGLVLAGDVDTFTAPRLRRLLTTTHMSTPVVRLELSLLDFVDLAGVRAVAAWAGRLHARSARLQVVAAPRLFRRMWELLVPMGIPEVSFTEDRP